MDNTLLYLIIIFIIITILIKKNYDHFNNIDENETIIEIPEFIPKRNNEEIFKTNIPLTIYQSWHSNSVPKNMAKNIKKLLDKNPEFDYYLYSDEKCRSFIQNNFNEDVVNAFDTLIPGAYKSDLWRYCILYINGGVYLDIKFYSNISLLSTLNNKSIIFVKDRFLYDMPFTSYYNIYNAYMASTPNNIIFKYCIDDIVASCKFKLYKNNPLDITGPGLLGSILIDKLPEKYNDYVKLSLNGEFGHALIVDNNNSIIFTEYKEYRNDQKLFQKKKHYHDLWHEKNVYN
jgi:mannosyltransferase OCH1-like enzyme